MNRTKTSLMLPKCLTPQIKNLARTMGISQSDLVSMALAMLLVQFGPLEKTPLKRKQRINEASKVFQSLLEVARESI